MAQEKVASPLTPKNTLLLIIKVGCNQWSAIPSRSIHVFKCQSSEFHLGILNCFSIPKPPEIGWSLNHEAKAFTLEFWTKFHPQKDLTSAPVVFFCMVLSQALLSPFRGRLHRVLSYHLPPFTGLSPKGSFQVTDSASMLYSFHTRLGLQQLLRPSFCLDLGWSSAHHGGERYGRRFTVVLPFCFARSDGIRMD